MTNVRLDANGVPKGPVYDPTAPASHRSGVTAVDASDPADDSGAIATAGYRECRLDLDISGTGFTSLEVQAIFWNARLGAWFGGALRRFTATGRWAIAAPCRGQKLYVKVTDFQGTSFSLDVDYSLS